MDHLDWLDEKATKEYAAALARQVRFPSASCALSLPALLATQPAKQFTAQLCSPQCTPAAHPTPTYRPSQVAPGGHVIWRSAAFVPPYARLIEEAGFDVRCIQRADQGFMVRRL